MAIATHPKATPNPRRTSTVARTAVIGIVADVRALPAAAQEPVGASAAAIAAVIRIASSVLAVPLEAAGAAAPRILLAVGAHSGICGAHQLLSSAAQNGLPEKVGARRVRRTRRPDCISFSECGDRQTKKQKPMMDGKCKHIYILWKTETHRMQLRELLQIFLARVSKWNLSTAPLFLRNQWEQIHHGLWQIVSPFVSLRILLPWAVGLNFQGNQVVVSHVLFR